MGARSPRSKPSELRSSSRSGQWIVADIGAIFAQLNLNQTNECHGSDAACATMYTAYGVDPTTGAALATQQVYPRRTISSPRDFWLRRLAQLPESHGSYHDHDLLSNNWWTYLLSPFSALEKTPKAAVLQASSAFGRYTSMWRDTESMPSISRHRSLG